jgi:hypothetical protein
MLVNCFDTDIGPLVTLFIKFIEETEDFPYKLTIYSFLMVSEVIDLSLILSLNTVRVGYFIVWYL